MRRAWPFALAACVGVTAFLVGRYVGRRPIAALEAKLAGVERERDVAHEVQRDVGTSLARAMNAPRPTPSPLLPSAPPRSQEDELAALMARINELTSNLDLGAIERFDMGAMHVEDAHKLRQELVDKVHLDEQQQQAIEPIVAELDRTLAAPLERIEKLEDAEFYSITDWAQAHAEAYQAMANAEQAFRDLLSPQQRELLDRTDFSVASQLDAARYDTLTERGLLPLPGALPDEQPTDQK